MSSSEDQHSSELPSEGSQFDFLESIPFSFDCPWSPEEDKVFETALAELEDMGPDSLATISGKLPGRSVEEMQRHYQALVDDIAEIERGPIPFPPPQATPSKAARSKFPLEPLAGEPPSSVSAPGPERSAPFSNVGVKRTASGNSKQNSGGSNPESKSGRKGGEVQERKRGIPWTEEEHRLFLLGLAKFGKGDWRSISRNFVISRTPTQVASHAQKYFLRLNSVGKDRRRASIYDITSIAGEGGEAEALPSGPITGQPTVNPPISSVPASSQPQATPIHPAVFMPQAASLPPPLGFGHVIPGHIGFGSHQAQHGLRGHGMPHGMAHSAFLTHTALHH